MQILAKIIISLGLIPLLASSAAPESIARQSEARPVRITIGSVETKNWEQGLIKNNPNLRHYHWNPMYSNVHKTKMVNPNPRNSMRGIAPPSGPGGSVHHKKSGAVARYQKVPARPSVYQKPVHLAPTASRRSSGEYKHIDATRAKVIARGKQVSADYRHASLPSPSRDAAGRLMPASRPVDKATLAQLRSNQVAASLGKRSADEGKLAKIKQLQLPADNRVSGNLVSKNTSASLATTPALTSTSTRASLSANTTSAELAIPKVLSYEKYEKTYGNKHTQGRLLGADPSNQITRATVFGRVMPGRASSATANVNN